MINIIYILCIYIIFIYFKCNYKIKGGNTKCPINYKLLKNTNKFMFNIKIIPRFNIYINNDNTIIYKIINNTKLGIKLKNSINNDKEFNIYKHILLNSYKINYNHTIPVFDIDRNGSYKSRYIIGYRLDKLNKNINKKIFKKILKQIDILKKNLYNNIKILTGDWALHNLIYSLKDDKIYNIDIEGFYTYQKLHEENFIELFNFLLNEVLNNI